MCCRKTAVLLLSLVLLSPSLASADPPVTKPPNIVLVLVDDLGWNDLSCQGSQYFETPHVDRLAADGMRFTDAYAACAVCSPTRAAVQTGRYPARVGVTDWIRSRFQGGEIKPDPPEYVEHSGRPLQCPRNPLFMEPAERTLAEALKPAGYVSCFIGKWHLGQTDQYPEKQGYDLNHGGCDLGQPPSYFDPYASSRKYYEIPNLPPRETGEFLTDREADEAVGFLRAHRDRPFFLALCHYAVHTPLMGKKDVIAKYQAKPKTAQNNAVYAAMVESVDDAMGKVLDCLDELQLTERTLVLFTSDNGGLLGPTNNAPLRSGKGFPYEGGIRVPLIVRWPGVVRPGSVSNVPVTSVDYFPTLLAAANVDPAEDRLIDGVDLGPVLSGKGTLDRDALFWHFPHYRGRLGPYCIIRKGPWKMIHRFETGQRELFNLEDDLSETTDLASQMLTRVAQLDEEMNTWLESVGAKLPRPNPDIK